MFRVKLLFGLFTLAAVGCNDSSSPSNKTGSSAKSPADGSGAK